MAAQNSVSNESAANKTVSSCRKKSSENGSFVTNLRDHIQEFIHTPMAEHKACLRTTYAERMAGLKTCYAARMASLNTSYHKVVGKFKGSFSGSKKA